MTSRSRLIEYPGSPKLTHRPCGRPLVWGQWTVYQSAAGAIHAAVKCPDCRDTEKVQTKGDPKTALYLCGINAYSEHAHNWFASTFPAWYQKTKG